MRKRTDDLAVVHSENENTNTRDGALTECHGITLRIPGFQVVSPSRLSALSTFMHTYIYMVN